jgi:hypothetical protein
MSPLPSSTVNEVPANIVLRFVAPRLQPIKPRVWPRALAAVAALGLLLGFYFAARAVETQGERRRLAVAAHEDATWRCRALMGRLPRANCLAQLNAPPEKLGKAAAVQVAVQRSER